MLKAFILCLPPAFISKMGEDIAHSVATAVIPTTKSAQLSFQNAMALTNKAVSAASSDDVYVYLHAMMTALPHHLQVSHKRLPL
jgi:hypothetical protein